MLAFQPDSAPKRTALIFICGSGVTAPVYTVLLRPVAVAGFPVFVVNLPYPRAPLESHRPIVFQRVRQVMAAHPEVSRWVMSGHSLGAALAASFAAADEDPLSGLLLIATTHPRVDDLSRRPYPVTKVYATNDGLVAVDRVRANAHLLPPHTRWVVIEGGNHAQFGRYIEPIADGEPGISRERQEALTRGAIIRLLASVDKRPP